MKDYLGREWMKLEPAMHPYPILVRLDQISRVGRQEISLETGESYIISQLQCQQIVEALISGTVPA